MRLRNNVFLVSLLILIPALLAAEFQQETLLTLQWGDGPDQLGLINKTSSELGIGRGGKFRIGPDGIAVDGVGNIYVADPAHEGILRYQISQKKIDRVYLDKGKVPLADRIEGDAVVAAVYALQDDGSFLMVDASNNRRAIKLGKKGFGISMPFFYDKQVVDLDYKENTFSSFGPGHARIRQHYSFEIDIPAHPIWITKQKESEIEISLSHSNLESFGTNCTTLAVMQLFLV